MRLYGWLLPSGDWHPLEDGEEHTSPGTQQHPTIKRFLLETLGRESKRHNYRFYDKMFRAGAARVVTDYRLEHTVEMSPKAIVAWGSEAKRIINDMTDSNMATIKRAT